MATASAPLRITRRQVAALVALSDIGGLWSLEQVTDALSAFADAAISGAIRFLLRRAGIAGDLELADDTRPDHESGLIVLGMMGEYFLPLLANFGFLEFLKHDQDVPDSDVTPAYCAEHNWLVGSPSTVAEKLEAVYNDVGGFGQLLVFGFDYIDQPEAWHTSLGLLKNEVLPKVQHLTPKPATAVA